MKEIIKQVKMRRHFMEMSQEEVNNKAGLSTHTMHKFEKGKINNLKTIIKIVNALGGEIRINFEKE
jgi:DNA-binding XRE family transcriptional regulator